MAMLLALFQKMRIQREYNQEVLNVAKFGRKVDRIAKSIKNVQKMYEGRIKMLEGHVKSATSIFRNNEYISSGLGTQGLSPYGGTSQFFLKMMSDGLTNNNSPINGLSQDLLSAFMSGALKPQYDDNKNITGYSNGSIDCTAEDYQKLSNASYQVQQMQAQVRMNVDMKCSNQEQAASIWLEAAKAQLDAEQDQALEPLEYEQTMMELDKEASEERMNRLKAELDSYTQLCQEEAKNAAPKFGLG